MFKKIDNQDMVQQKLSDGSIKRYVKGRLLGKGGFAKCYEVTSLQTQKKYAAKIIEKASLQKSKAKQKLTSEIKIHKSLDHPYVVHFEHYFEDAEFVYILLEKCSNQTLNELLKRRKRLTDIETKYYIRQLAVAIKYIHDHHIIHRDLKLGNLFLSEKLEIKIGDFGLATKLSYVGERKKTKCGTPNYIAPEILDDKKSHSYEVDIWSIGVITYALLVGRPPFQTSDVKDTYNKIRACNYSFPVSANIPDLAKSFIQKLLQLDPSKRATIDQILTDPFLSQSTIPSCLPISSLACPPSFDFLKKYRDLETEQSKISIKNRTEHVEIESAEQQKKPSSSNAASQEKACKDYKFVGRVNSVEKTLKATNRVLSAANLLGNVKQSKKINVKTNELKNKALKIWVTYFIENPKYGMGYMLNSNAVGFKYNDSSVAVTNCKHNRMKYIEYDPTTKKVNESDAIIYQLEEAEQKEYKKYKILTHFQRDLAELKASTENQMTNEARIKIEEMKFRENAENAMKCYVTRYHRTSNSTIFWLSVGALQVVFEDGSQILVNENGVLTYMNKFRDAVYFEQENKELQSQQIKKRLIHFYGVVKTTLLKKNQSAVGENKPISKGSQKSQTMSRCNSSKPGCLTNSNVNIMSTKTGQLKTSASNANLKKIQE